MTYYRTNALMPIVADGRKDKMAPVKHVLGAFQLWRWTKRKNENLGHESLWFDIFAFRFARESLPIGVDMSFIQLRRSCECRRCLLY